MHFNPTVFAIAGLTLVILTNLWSQKTMTAALDRLTASVASLTTAEESLVTLVNGLAEQIRNNVGDDDALNSLADSLDADTASITAAVTANTTPTPPAPPSDAAA